MLADFVMVEERGKQAKRELDHSPIHANTSSNAEAERLTRELEAAQATLEEYKLKHSDLQQEISQSLQSKQQLESEVQNLRSDLEAVKATHTEALDQASELEAVKRTLQETQSSHMETESALRSTLSEKSQLVALHEASLSNKDAERDALLAGHEATLSQTSRDLEVAKEKITYLETQVAAISKEYQDAKVALEAAHGDLEIARRGVSDVALERDAAKARVEKVSADYETKSQDHRDATSALDVARSEIEQHKSIAETAKTERAKLQDQFTSLQKEAADIRTSHDSANARIAELEAAAVLHASIKADLEHSSAQVEDLKRNRAELEEQLHSSQSDNDHHTQSKAELQKKLDDHVNYKSVLQKQLDDHITSKSLMQTELDNHVRSLSVLQTKLDDHASSKTELEKQLGELSLARADLETAQAKIAELQNGSDEKLRILQADLDGHVRDKATLITQLENLSGLETDHKTTLSKLAELENNFNDHQTQLSTAHARIADLTKDADSHALLQTEHANALSRLAETKQQLEAQLSTSTARIEELNRDIEGHAVVKTDLENALAKITQLSEAVNAHGPVQAELEAHREKIAALNKAAEEHQTTLAQSVEEHGAVKAELESHQQQVVGLSKALEQHESVKTELDAAHTRLSHLEKDVETHKSEKGSISEQLAAAEAALASVTESHERLNSKVNEAEERLVDAEKNLQITKDAHESNLATLAGKSTAIEHLQEQNILLQQELKASLDSERAARIAVQDLEKNLNAVNTKLLERGPPEPEKKSHVSEAAMAAGAMGLAGAGAFGLVKAFGNDDEEEAKAPEVIGEHPLPVEEEEPRSDEHVLEHQSDDKDVTAPQATTETAERVVTPQKEESQESESPLASSEIVDPEVKDGEDLPVTEEVVENFAQSQETHLTEDDSTEVQSPAHPVEIEPEKDLPLQESTTAAGTVVHNDQDETETPKGLHDESSIPTPDEESHSSAQSAVKPPSSTSSDPETTELLVQQQFEREPEETPLQESQSLNELFSSVEASDGTKLLHSAVDNSVEVVSEPHSDAENSHLSDAVIAAGALGLVGAGAFGVIKASKDDDDYEEVLVEGSQEHAQSQGLVDACASDDEPASARIDNLPALTEETVSREGPVEVEKDVSAEEDPVQVSDHVEEPAQFQEPVNAELANVEEHADGNDTGSTLEPVHSVETPSDDEPNSYQTEIEANGEQTQEVSDDGSVPMDTIGEDATNKELGEAHTGVAIRPAADILSSDDDEKDVQPIVNTSLEVPLVAQDDHSDISHIDLDYAPTPELLEVSHDASEPVQPTSSAIDKSASDASINVHDMTADVEGDEGAIKSNDGPDTLLTAKSPEAWWAPAKSVSSVPIEPKETQEHTSAPVPEEHTVDIAEDVHEDHHVGQHQDDEEMESQAHNTVPEVVQFESMAAEESPSQSPAAETDVERLLTVQDDHPIETNDIGDIAESQTPEVLQAHEVKIKDHDAVPAIAHDDHPKQEDNIVLPHDTNLDEDEPELPSTHEPLTVEADVHSSEEAVEISALPVAERQMEEPHSVQGPSHVHETVSEVANETVSEAVDDIEEPLGSGKDLVKEMPGEDGRSLILSSP